MARDILAEAERAAQDLHPHAIGEKVRIMVEHFAAQVQNEIGGKAKAMIVTRSRLHAVRFRLAVDKYLAERGLPFKALVAFSGTVQDGARAYTETAMNGFSGTPITSWLKMIRQGRHECAPSISVGAPGRRLRSR
jgi:hypothetical protein